jgi:quinol monooxygenase YgiN
MNSQIVTLVVTFQARPGKEAELRALLTGMLAPTRQEAGCLNYDLHAAPDDPSRFLIYENWAGKAFHEAHDKTPHVQNLRAHIHELAFQPVKTFWEKIGSF